MKRFLLVFLTLAATQAAPIQLGYGENEAGNGGLTTRTYNSTFGVLTVQAFSLYDGVTWDQTSTTQFGVAQSAGTNLGIGVCNDFESCGSDSWQLDNNDGSSSTFSQRDFVLFTFDRSVTNVVIRIHQTTTNHDADAVWGTTPVSTVVSTLNIASLFSNLGNGSTGNSLPGGTLNIGSFRDIAITGSVRQILLGVPGLSTPDSIEDYFKVKSVDAIANPEPGALLLMGSGLVGLSAIARWRRRQ
jgi:hypothetical protein